MQKAVHKKEDVTSPTRLRRRTVRKGFAFPWPSYHVTARAMPWRRGESSKNISSALTVSQRLTALGGGRAALRMFALCFLLSAFCLLALGCRRDMHDQPKMKPYRSSSFFKDGLSSRPFVDGTVARGRLNADTEYYTGKKAGRPTTNQATAGPRPATSSGPALQGPAAYPDDLEVFPRPVTKEMMARGKERYEIFCTACHGLTGKGDGMIVRRGFRRAASFHDENLRQAPVGHYFDAITNGWGAMPSYAHQIPVEDRWAIVAYIRALQFSQQNQQAPQPGPLPAAAPAPVDGGHR